MPGVPSDGCLQGLPHSVLLVCLCAPLRVVLAQAVWEGWHLERAHLLAVLVGQVPLLHHAALLLLGLWVLVVLSAEGWHLERLLAVLVGHVPLLHHAALPLLGLWAPVVLSAEGLQGHLIPHSALLLVYVCRHPPLLGVVEEW